MLAETIAAGMFLCQPVAIYDGDTLTCSTGVRVRLAAIDSPELKGCRGRRGRVCVPGDGYASRKALAGLVWGKALQCARTGTSYNRVTAWCSAGGVDVSCQMVRQGAAVYLERYDRGRRMCR